MGSNMNNLIKTLFAAALVASAPLQASEDVTGRVAESKATIRQFFEELKGNLVAAIKEGGPVNAIQVCSEKAPGIARSISEERGWQVGRTSLKLRNPANAPDEWELKVLESFESRKAAGEDPQQIAFHEVVEQDGKRVFRFMKAIPTAEKPCLVCHGGEVPPPVEAKLKELYPTDKARGYVAGDIRGAFTISQPMD
jgi:hypothetical protein